MHHYIPCDRSCHDSALRDVSTCPITLDDALGILRALSYAHRRYDQMVMRETGFLQETRFLVMQVRQTRLEVPDHCPFTAGASGRVKLKVLPSPTRLSTPTCPPIFSTIRRTMDSPNPCPLALT
jgi:hypothetical protein